MSQQTLEDRVVALEQQLAALQAAREEDRRRFEQATALRAERDAYRRSLYAWGQQQFTEEELRDYPEEEGLDFVEFLEQLEQQRGA